MKSSQPALTPQEVAAEIARLDVTIAEVDQVRSSSVSVGARRAELCLPWAVFARRMRLLTPQSYGARMQNYMIDFFGWSRVPASADRGDALVDGSDYVEIKCSMITGSNTDVNLVQVRPYQDIAGYRVFVVDGEYRVFRFDLTAAQMHAELELCGQLAHGTTAAAAANTNREYALRFTWTPDNPVFVRWMGAYLVASTAECPTPDLMPANAYQSFAQLRA